MTAPAKKSARALPAQVAKLAAEHGITIPPEGADFYPLDLVKPWVSNPKKNHHAVPRVVRSIKKHGWGRPLVVNAHPKAFGELIIGHTARLAALELGLDKVPIRWVVMAPKRAHALALADNKTAEFSSWDQDLLRELKAEGVLEDTDFLDAGFSEAELAELAGNDNARGTRDGTRGRAAARGDLWILGPHRIVVGLPSDETIAAHVTDTDAPALVVLKPAWADAMVSAWEELTGRKAKRKKA